MGRVKEIMIKMEQYPFYGVSDRLVSAHLFGNKRVREFVLKNGFDGFCSYCGDMTKVLPLRSIVEYIDSIILKYFGDPDNEGLGWDSHFGDEKTLGFHDEEGGYITPDNRSFYNDMRQLLFETGFHVDDDDLETDIADALSYHIHLVEKDPYGLNGTEDRWVDWQIIKEEAMKMAKADVSLDDMVKHEKARLDYLKEDIYQAHYPLQIKRSLTLYRVVNYDKKRLPLLFRDLSSPPEEYTRDLRMSRKGDSVFYGAENMDTALKEALIDNGDKYSYIGKFCSKHDLRLLDLTKIPALITIFDQEQFHLLLFLQLFCKAVSEPNKDHDSIEYAPTQLITYYFRHWLRHYEADRCNYPIDGIIYTSSKDGAMNAVLFYDNKESRKHLELQEWTCIHEGQPTTRLYPRWMKYVDGALGVIRDFWL